MRQMYQTCGRAGYIRDWTFPAPGGPRLGKVTRLFGHEGMRPRSTSGAAHAEVRLPEVHLAPVDEPVERQGPLRLPGVELGRELLPSSPPHVPLDRGVGAAEAPSVSLSNTLLAVWRRLNQQRLSSISHESTSPADGPGRGDSGALPTAGGLSDRSGSLRYFLAVGSETPVSRAMGATLAPPLPSFLISSILSTPTISFLAPNRRNRSNDNGWPNGMVGALALRPETFSRSFPKRWRAQIHKAKAIKHTTAALDTPSISATSLPAMPDLTRTPRSAP